MNLKCSSSLSAIALGSFDLLSGVKVINTWIYTENFDICLEDIFRMNLSNIHRQSEESVNSFVPSIFDIKHLNLLVISSIFMIEKKPHNVYYSLILLLDSSSIKFTLSPNFYKTLQNHCVYLASLAKNILKNNENIQKLQPFLDQTKENCNIFLNSCIQPNFELYLDVSPVDSQFLAIALSSHLQTQMTTVIEANSKEEAYFLMSFLYCFTLPFQREHSSFEMNDTIIHGLYLQCVKPQDSYIDDLILTFRTPTTYIKLPERSIFITPNIEKQKQIYENWRETLTLDSQTAKKKIADIRKEFKISLKKVNYPAPWSLVTLSLITQVQQEYQESVCELQFSSFIKMALNSIAIVKSMVEDTTKTLSYDEFQNICKELKITGAEDLNLLFSVAQIFDKSFHVKIATNKSK